MPKYITLPITITDDSLLALAVSWMQAKIPGWRPLDAELDYIMLQSNSLLAAELATIASEVPDAIFRYFGNSLMNLPPNDPTQATTTMTFTAINNAGHSMPAGTYVGIRTSGDQMIPFQTVSDVTIPPGSTVAAGVPVVAVNPGAASSGLGGVATPAETIDPIDWISTVTVDAMTTGGEDGETNQAYLDRLRADLQTMSPRPILPNDFAVLARSTDGVYRAQAIDGYNPSHNYLTANEASIETDISGWANGGNATPTRSIAQSTDGVASMSLASIAAGNMSAGQVRTTMPVIGGDEYVMMASFRAATVARSSFVGVSWYDSSHVQIGSTVFSTGVNDTTTGWTQVSALAIAPPNAAFARIIIQVNSTGAAGEVHYVDKIGFVHATSSPQPWVAGDSPEYGNERMVGVGAIDINGAPVSPIIRNAVRSDLDAKREVNFVVNMLDPFVSLIDVSYTVIKRKGADTAIVLANVNQAIANYLNPAAWGLDPNDADPTDWINQPYVRYLELATVINNVSDVDYVTSLFFGLHGASVGTADLALPGVIPLPSIGTLAGSVS